MICKNTDCSNSSKREDHGRNGYCCSCYKRAPKSKISYKKAKSGSGENFIKKIVEKSLITPTNDCIIYPFAKNKDGYGKLIYKGKDFRAHRLSLILYSGKNKSSELAAHGPCNNPSCINPLHLYWATYKRNAEDKKRDGTQHKGESHPMAKLNVEKVKEIKKDLLNLDLTLKNICEKYEISAYTLCRIQRGKSWEDVPWPVADYEKIVSKRSKKFVKLNKSQAEEIRNLIDKGSKVKHIAEKYQVHIATIYNIKKNKYWK